MKQWISTGQQFIFTVGVVVLSWVFNGTQEAVATEPPSGYETTCSSEMVASSPVWIDEHIERLVRFQSLVAQWHAQRGATSSVSEMCSRPAYLSIMAMGPDALPLIITQLRSEGDDPDHWFVALHHISGGADPVPDEDKGDMEKMAKAWIEWSERYAG